MANELLKQKESSRFPLLDADFETKLLASQLVSEVRKSPDHVSFTLTGYGVIEFAKAMQLYALEEQNAAKLEASNSLFPDANDSLIPKTEVMKGLKVSHTTLWKWQVSGYLIPVKVGKRVYYKREDIERITKK